MKTTQLLSMALAALFAPPAYVMAQEKAKTPQECEAEISRTEGRIAEARKATEFKSDKGRQALTTADRYLNQARKHASKNEPRACVTAAQKGRATLSAR